MGLCHHITVLDYGSVVAAGPPEIVRVDPRVLDAYLGVGEESGEDSGEDSGQGGDEPGE